MATLDLSGEWFDPANRRVVQEDYRPPGRMASPDWYCRTRDRIEMRRPE